MSSLFSRRDKVDVPPVRAPREGGRTRMAGERPSRTRRRRSEERQRSIEEALEKRRRGRRSRRREEERSRSRSRRLVGVKRKRPLKNKESEVVLDTLKGTGERGPRRDPERGGRRSDPRPPRPEGRSGPRRDPERGVRTGGRRDEGKMVDSRGSRRSDPRREKVYHPIVKSKTPKDQRPVKEDRGPVNILGRRVDPMPTGKRDGDPRPPRPEGRRGGRTGGRRSGPRPDRDRNRGRRRVRDEAFERRRRSNSSPPPRKATRAEMEERRRNPLGMGQVAEI